MMDRIHRRTFLTAASLGLLGPSLSGLGECGLGNWSAFAEDAPKLRQASRHCILLWMSGGPSQLDTFDLKPGHANGGEFKEIATATPGLRWSEHLPILAKESDQIAVVRSLSTKEGDHGRGTYLMRTGQRPQGPIAYPSIGAVLSKGLQENRLAEADGVLGQVAINPFRVFNPAAFGPGFLGPQFAPLTVAANDGLAAAMAPAPMSGYAALPVDDLSLPAGVSTAQADRRTAMWRKMQGKFQKDHATSAVIAHGTMYERALALMASPVSKAFELEGEPKELRDAYGAGKFGQGCLMARRLVERGVPFVEVSLGPGASSGAGWDTHQNNFADVKKLSAELDAGFGTLVRDLRERGLLERTTILWMGEFGRTPKINPQGGRDHFPVAWSCVMAGGDIRGGQAYGKTTDDGMEVADGKVDVGDVLATLVKATGLRPDMENISPEGRPIKLAEGKPIEGLLV